MLEKAAILRPLYEKVREIRTWKRWDAGGTRIKGDSCGAEVTTRDLRLRTVWGRFSPLSYRNGAGLLAITPWMVERHTTKS
jgi:hypothetical protein